MNGVNEGKQMDERINYKVKVWTTALKGMATARQSPPYMVSPFTCWFPERKKRRDMMESRQIMLSRVQECIPF